MKKDITVYHVDKLYGTNDEVRYAVFPYSLMGTLRLYFGVDFRNHCWEISYYPWYLRFTGFVKWFSLTRLSPKSAEILANKMRRAEYVKE